MTQGKECLVHAKMAEAVSKAKTEIEQLTEASIHPSISEDTRVLLNEQAALMRGIVYLRDCLEDPGMTVSQLFDNIKKDFFDKRHGPVRLDQRPRVLVG